MDYDLEFVVKFIFKEFTSESENESENIQAFIDAEGLNGLVGMMNLDDMELLSAKLIKNEENKVHN